MINNLEFAERLKKVMDHYQLSAAAFADKIDVQRSSISHLLSGRNRPSLDFVLKVLDVFPAIELYWLLNGKGTFPKSDMAPTVISDDHTRTIGQETTTMSNEIDRIIIFYKDGTFKNYTSGTKKKS